MNSSSNGFESEDTSRGRCFKELRVDGLPFFRKKIDGGLKNVFKHVEAGCVSDTPGISMHKGTVGEVLKCIRGTNSLEAFHRHLLHAFSGFSYGPELFDAILSE